MGFIDIFLTALLSYVICNRIGRKFPKIWVLTLSVIITIPVVLMLLLFIQTELVSPEFRNVESVFGMGFWFTLFGAVFGAFDGRRRGLKKLAEQIDNEAPSDSQV